jgi:hypothetical protein
VRLRLLGCWFFVCCVSSPRIPLAYAILFYRSIDDSREKIYCRQIILDNTLRQRVAYPVLFVETAICNFDLRDTEF